MVKYEIYIFISSFSSYSVQNTPNALAIQVIPTVPFDKISKRFNMYTHRIKYREEYKPSDYDFYIYDKSKFFVWDVFWFRYYHPRKQVESVELYYSTEKNRNTPLVVGFNQKGVEKTIYYTHNFLRAKQYAHGLPYPGNFESEDLITRLTEEFGLHLGSRRNEIVVEINDKSSNTDKNIKYPKTGPNREKITLSKSKESVCEYFEKFVHNIDPGLKESFYISYENNSLYVNDKKFNSDNLKSVEVFFSTYVNTNTPLVIGFITKNGIKNYYSIKDIVDKNIGDIKLEELRKLESDRLETELKEENDKLNKGVEYLIEQKTEYSYKVKISRKEDIKNGNGYFKFNHTPETNYSKKSSLILFNGNKLMKKGEKGNIEEIKEIQNEIYTSITVFFGTKDPNFPLIIQLTGTTGVNNYYVHKKDKDYEYWEKLEIKPSNESEILDKLKSEEASLSTYIFILINKQKKYTREEIQHSRDVKLTTSQPETIEVNEKQDCEQLKGSYFKCYEHSLSGFKSSQPSGKDNIILKLLISIGYGLKTDITRYTELNLYYNSEKTREYINYNESQNSLCVYFYDKDPRPLLVSYGDKVYIPSDLYNYYNKWIVVTNINSSTCSSGDKNNSLLNTLQKVLYFLNPVRLEENMIRDKTKKEYNINKFHNSTETGVKINIGSEDLNCNKKYTHTPTSGYILGEISHNGSKLFTNYEEYKSNISPKNTNKFPDKVSVYYYIYDKDHKYPLLVALEFKNNLEVNATNKQYYKLSDKDNFEWTKIENFSNLEDQIELEKQLKEIRNGLGIYYENKEENLIIKSADKCKEGDNSAAVAGTLTTLGLAGVGTGVAYYKYPELFASLYRRILRWIPVTRIY